MLSILHADGDRELRVAHAGFLAAQGYEVHTAAGGVECVEKLRHFSPRLLILDDELPWGGGAGVLGVMREESRLRRISVVLTSRASSADALDFALPPVVCAFVKPYQLTELLAAFVRASEGPGTGSVSQPCTAACLLKKVRAQLDGDLGHSIDKDAPRSDDVATVLEREIRTRTWGRVKDLRVDCIDGVMVVHGHAQTYYVKQLVLVAAMTCVAGRGVEVAFDVEVS